MRPDDGDAHDVRLAISCAEPFFAVPCSIVIPGLRGSGTPHAETVRFYFRGDGSGEQGVVPSELTAKVVAMYRTSKGHPRTAMETISLPMSLAARVIAPSKEGKFKITLDVPSMPRLRALFSEMLETSSVSGVAGVGGANFFPFHSRSRRVSLWSNLSRTISIKRSVERSLFFFLLLALSFSFSLSLSLSLSLSAPRHTSLPCHAVRC